MDKILSKRKMEHEEIINEYFLFMKKKNSNKAKIEDAIFMCLAKQEI